MEIEEILERVKECLENEPKPRDKDVVWRALIATTELDVFKYITHDETINPSARKHGTIEDEELSWGQLFVQLFACAILRQINVEKAIEQGLVHWKVKDWQTRKTKDKNVLISVGIKVIKGEGFTPGVAKGEAVVITADEILKGKVLTSVKGEKILVTEHVAVDDMTLLRNRGFLAMVTDEGTSVCHGATLAKELGIPSVLGTGVATMEIKSGDCIIVNGDSCEVSIFLEKYDKAKMEVRK